MQQEKILELSVVLCSVDLNFNHFLEHIYKLIKKYVSDSVKHISNTNAMI